MSPNAEPDTKRKVAEVFEYHEEDESGTAYMVVDFDGGQEEIVADWEIWMYRDWHIVALP